MTTMKAVCLERFGGPGTLRMKDVERPEPGPGEVLVKVHATRVNPVDCKARSGQYPAAAAVPLAAIAAWQGLFDHGDLLPGQRVLIHGCAGGVGHFAIQLAKSLGATVATTVAGQDEDFVRSLGADRVIDYRKERCTHTRGRIVLQMST